MRACEQLVTLVAEKNTNENVLRKLFLQIGIISSDCITVLRPKQSGYGYFAKKGMRNANKFPLEMDEMVLETRLSECKLVHGVDFFSRSDNSISFVKSKIIPALEGAKKPPAVDTIEECEQEEKRDDPRPVEKDNKGVNDLELPEIEGNEVDNDLPEEEGEAGKDLPEAEGAGSGKDAFVDPPQKKPKHAPKNPRIPKFVPVKVSLEDRKF